ncbi:hypothetical protein [Jiangella sp. DSM 45060]|uniref:hypothetical protein n=1 Tax=Jiangella sp. DSM 45060 TaxID=1798224 RepID=UPI00087CBFB8|nr:hypothetical protein [Jiangella sp. DSM 45060]SDT66382.1 hypothetical protein SAMN04515669_5596 [Jiangella sp. DSM 45060]
MRSPREFFRRSRQEPPCLLDPRVYDATVRHHERVGSVDEVDYVAVFVTLRPAGRDVDVIARLGDIIAPVELPRFGEGTHWRVRLFEPAKLWVAMLAPEHDDVLRTGRDLGGVRWDAESWYWHEPRPGSPYTLTRDIGPHGVAS